MKKRNLFIILGIVLIFLIGIILVLNQFGGLQIQPLTIVGWVKPDPMDPEDWVGDNSLIYVTHTCSCKYPDAWSEPRPPYANRWDDKLNVWAPAVILSKEELGYSDCEIRTDWYLIGSTGNKPCICVVCKECPPDKIKQIIPDAINQYGYATCIVKECELGEKKCENNNLMVCRENIWTFNRVCDYGCEEGECLTIPEPPKPTLFRWIDTLWDWIKSIFS